MVFPKKHKQGGIHKRQPAPKTNHPLLACPWSKASWKQHPKCQAHPGYPKICYLFQHIARSHRLSEFECSRCGVVFDEKEKDAEKEWEAHVQQCQDTSLLRLPPDLAKLTHDQFQHLRDKCSRRDKPEVNWYRIWDTQFPSRPRAASPYAVDIHQQLLAFVKSAIVAKFGAAAAEDLITTILDHDNAQSVARIATPGEDPRPMSVDQASDSSEQSLLAPTDGCGTDMDESATAIYPASDVLPQVADPVSSFLQPLDLSPPASTSANVQRVDAIAFDDADMFAPAFDGYDFPATNLDTGMFDAADVDPDLSSHHLGWFMRI